MSKQRHLEPPSNLSQKAQAIWREIVAGVKHVRLQESDRTGLKALVVLVEVLDEYGLSGRGLGAREFGLMVQLIAHFGLSPKTRLALIARGRTKKKLPSPERD
jgi:phage terminase small subunit